MLRWLLGKGAKSARVERELAAIEPARWSRVLERYAFLRGLNADEEAALRHRSAWVLASKGFSGAQGLLVTDEMKLAVAVQAALPIMHLDPRLYEGWTEIVLYPGGFVIPRTDVDESGVVHEYLEEASGEAWEGGPLILSWEDCAPGPRDDVNVVIHEFVHKLDLYHGEADGMPWLGRHGPLSAARWHAVLHASYDDFCARVETVEAAIPADIDPESHDAEPWYVTLPLDAYAATDTAEFFAVSAESFFVNPASLAACYPDWYRLLAQYFRQDPLTRLGMEPAAPPPLPSEA